MKKQFLVFGGFSGASAVALGAMAAHFLESKMQAGLLTERNLHAFKTAAEYQMYHAIALIGIALLSEKVENEAIARAGYSFVIGTVLFSGSLYFLSTGSLMGLPALKWLGPVTPIGGLFFIIGWLFLAFAGLRKKDVN